ncbi:uncharacterized protein PRCAT00006299001 [Priceomyces carsonii]|uniref:uncharacterized protein n=1 Tax=Priceomyces carsonii TaxID=28549 RepID=UPI002EDA4D02|nr:unnamed protein product [Priceomyces carsonii]
MPCMYFSGEESESITIDDPNSRCVRINAELYARVQNNEQNTRVFLDTHLLRIRDDHGEQESSSGSLVPKGDASISVEIMPLMSLLVYVTDALTTAEFREISSDGFKERYLAPLDAALKRSNIEIPLLASAYAYPFGDANQVEGDIQEYFNEQLASTIKLLYRDICGLSSYFGKPSIIRPPLDRRRVVKPDIAHIMKKGSFRDLQSTETCFAIGDYKKGNYSLAQGFEELKVAVEHLKQNPLDTKRLRRLRRLKYRPLFQNREWSPKVLFALVLRKYLYQAFLCGTDRFFISDHQTFSGFFEFEIVDDKMIIDYYAIDNPETVAQGITLRSAIAGFFYKNTADALDTKKRLLERLDLAKKTEGQDPFQSVLPRSTSGSSGKLSSNEFAGKLGSIKENSVSEDFDEIHGNTYCRIICDTEKLYPNLKLPYEVFVKLYYYSSQLWEENDLTCFDSPDRRSYYDMFLNELAINEKLAKSRYASNFPKLLISGYWNGLPDHPMHIFESLGKKVAIEDWDMDIVFKVIKSRLEELHLLGISHNDVRPANIHVSLSGEISLIDFGLSDCTNNEELKKNDLISLHYIFGLHGDSENIKNCNQINHYGEDSILSENVDNGSNNESDNNSSDEVVFDEMSLKSHDTRTTKEDFSSKGYS